ncbi:MAG: hypothetical protein J6A61_09145 [Clostridia bacterium]|nr:hypothetical protein [Clostridia bacterium]
MKKTILFSLVCASVMLFAMIFDYLYNERFHRVQFYKASLTDIQNQMEFSAPVEYRDGLYLMTGAVTKIDNVTEGAGAVVTWGGETLEGYLYRLEPVMDEVYRATVSVIAQRPLEGDATAVIYGTFLADQMLIPEECVVTDSKGRDAVFVEMNNYAVLRNVELGKHYPSNQVQILSGVLPDEQVILTPEHIRAGDRISSP